MIRTNDTESVIEIVGLTKQYGEEKAVDHLSLEIKRGSTFGLIGPNGAGKSSLIKMIMGVLSPTKGTIRVLGREVEHEAIQIKQRVGYVPDSHLMDRWMKVGDVIGFCREAFAVWNDQLCGQMVELFELDPTKKVKQLSKGMQVKLSLVLAVSHEPEVLVLDEPMAGLDPIAREEFLDGVLRNVCQREQTVIFSTHSLDDVQRMADTVGILYEGKLLENRKIDELLSSSKRIQATLTNGELPVGIPENVIWQKVEGRQWNVTVSDFSDEIVQNLKDQSGIEHIEVMDLSLEDLFKDYVRGRKVKV